MPNHVSNCLYIKAETAEKINNILEAIKGIVDEDGEEVTSPIDFNSILPEPCSNPDDYDWYHWRLNNWGTKWNAYWADVSYVNEEEGNSLITFSTAWSTCKPVIHALSEKFLDVEFTVEYADEDFSYNCGRYTYEDGFLIEEYHPEGGSIEAAKFAAEILGYSEDDFIFREDGTWDWNGDE